MSSSTATSTPTVHLGPDQPPLLVDAITAGGGQLTGLHDADAVVWTGAPSDFPTLPTQVRWVQLPSAGVESWFQSGVVDAGSDRVWTSAAGAYADSVAEHALALLLAGVRALPGQLAATSWDQAGFGAQVRTLRGSLVAIVGCGGIGRALIPLLSAVGAHTLAVTRSGRTVPGAVETLPAERTAEVWGRADHVVLGAPATGQTKYLLGAQELAQMKSTAWVVNIARGSLIDTDALVEALTEGRIGGAALDVTEPEPLPDGHPLWTLPNAIITPHVANPPSALAPAFAQHVSDNVSRFARGQALAAVIDPASGY
ncbi:D-isomer specific 2-hydroxyacid dehydrogenase family protein [Rhodococcus sp. NPDC059968]|uniref:D-isomer specific 2-hydroxyacid dehydrogenase family protein n=1 Tax=Rhodococcus sp. NPDC059968 TaxID=3347017 RepID=UPI00366D2C1E